jgi:hypothetical protein
MRYEAIDGPSASSVVVEGGRMVVDVAVGEDVMTRGCPSQSVYVDVV